MFACCPAEYSHHRDRLPVSTDNSDPKTEEQVSHSNPKPGFLEFRSVTNQRTGCDGFSVTEAGRWRDVTGMVISRSAEYHWMNGFYTDVLAGERRLLVARLSVPRARSVELFNDQNSSSKVSFGEGRL